MSLHRRLDDMRIPTLVIINDKTKNCSITKMKSNINVIKKYKSGIMVLLCVAMNVVT